MKTKTHLKIISKAKGRLNGFKRLLMFSNAARRRQAEAKMDEKSSTETLWKQLTVALHLQYSKSHPNLHMTLIKVFRENCLFMAALEINSFTKRPRGRCIGQGIWMQS